MRGFQANNGGQRRFMNLPSCAWSLKVSESVEKQSKQKNLAGSHLSQTQVPRVAIRCDGLAIKKTKKKGKNARKKREKSGAASASLCSLTIP